MKKQRNILKIPGVWVILFLLILGGILFWVMSRKKETGYLLLSNFATYACDKEFCKKVTNSNIDVQNQIFQTYRNTEKLGDYTISYVNKWNFFDENHKWVNLSSNFIAGSKNLNLNVFPYETREMNESELASLDKILKDNAIVSYKQLQQNEVIEYDFNKNGKKEKVILASNASDESEDEKLFSIAFSIINNKTNVIFLETYNQNENYSVPIFQIKAIFNIFQNKEDNLVLLKGYFSEEGKTTPYIYKVEKNKFQLISD